MKKIIIYGFMVIAIVINIYLIFIWTPDNLDDLKSQSVIYTYKPTYTFDKDEILKKLSDNEEDELKHILEKMSVFDMECVKKYLNQGEEEDIRKAFSIMKRRLSVNDYRKIKEIFDEFMDMSIIEKV